MNVERDPGTVAPYGEEELIEGGDVTLTPGEVPWKARKHHAETASGLARAIFFVLAGSALLHYTAMAVFTALDFQPVAEALERIFDVWLPVISGFFGAAVTYYFTRDSSSR